MAANTLYREQALLNTLRGITFAGVSPFVGLLVALPTAEGGSYTEASGVAYARKAITFTAPERYDSDGQGSHFSWMTNTAEVLFDYVGAGTWGTVLGIGIFDAVSGGNLLCIATLATPKVTELNDLITIPASAISITQD